jgi:hypothetical protein
MSSFKYSNGGRRHARLHALLALLALSLAALTGAAARAHAQQATRRAVPTGEVTGLELGLEGSLEAVPGGKMRFLIALHEVVRQRDLRPAPGAEVRVVTSFRRDRPVAEVVTDADGRAAVLFDVPADIDSNGFHVTFDARSPRRIRRRFDIDVAAVGDSFLELTVDRVRVAPGSPVRAFGRLLSRITGGPLADAEVSLVMTSGQGPLGAAHVVRTGPTGAFGTTFTAPSAPAQLVIRADHSGALLVSMQHSVEVAVDPEPPLVVRAAPERSVLEGAGDVRVNVVVRTPRGRPVAGAQVVVGPIPHAEPGEPVPVLPLTGADGHALVPWHILPGQVPAGAIVDIEETVSVVRTGVAAATGTVHVRIARVPNVARIAVEGGALAPGLPGKLFLRVVSADGSAAAGIDVRVESGRFGAALTARTDAAGYAVLDATLAPEPADAAPDACGGATALAATVTVLGPRETSQELCLPVDPDATLRVRPLRDRVGAGNALEAEVLRGPSVLRNAVVVTLLGSRHDGYGQRDLLVPLAYRVLPAGTTRVSLPVPAEAVGALVVRARALVPLPNSAVQGAREEVRGGSAVVLATRGASFAAQLVRDADGTLRITDDGPRAARSVVAIALPARDARALAETLRALDGPLAAALVAAPASELRLAAALAAHTPHDAAAPAVLRDGAVLPVPAPEDPVTLGVLRDPSRARARFVAGRLALVLRTLEAYVASHVPDAMEDISVRTPRGWAFNREILDAVTGSADFGPEGARGLDGLPLTIDALAALDPALTYDRMARRITRRRLFDVLVALRTLARSRNLDLAWAWRGDPQTWLPRLLEESDDESGEMLLERADLFDGWGHPFVVRPAPGGRARFGMIAPVAGYEVLSVGPDGRPGTADDVWDPLARVLPSGGAYATAVDEDAFIARAGGVELGRATISSLAALFDAGVEPVYRDSVAAGEASGALDEVPSALAPIDARAFEPQGTSRGAGVGPRPLVGGALRLALVAPDEPRRFIVVAQTLAADGARAIATLAVPPGTPVVVDAQLPPRLRAGETLTVPFTVSALTDDVRSVRLAVETSGPITAQLETPTDATVALEGAGDTKTLSLVLAASAALDTAARTATVRITTSGDGLPTRTVTRTLSVDDGTVLRRLTRGALVESPTELRVELPDDARDAEAVLVIAPPDALALDPSSARLASTDPALLAWAETLAGRTPDRAARGELRAALLSARTADYAVRGDAPILSTACALVAWSAAEAEDGEAQTARIQAARFFASAEGAYADSDAQAGALRLNAATLAALAAGASGSVSAIGESVDPIAERVATLREGLRVALSTHRRAPGVLGRAAAALLLADADDAQARAMLELASRALVERRGRTFLPRVTAHAASPGFETGDEDDAASDAPDPDEAAGDDPGEDLAGTAALALAAHQIGNTALLARLRPFIANRVERSLGAGGEAAFWTLAAAAYGALGQPPPSPPEGAGLTATVGGARTPLALTTGPGGVVRGALSPPAAGSDVRVSLTPTTHGPRLARLEVVYARPTTARDDAPMRLSLSGDAGYAGESSALEVVIENTSSSPIEAPVLELALPAAARADADVRATLARAPGVVAVDAPDARGLMRVHLAALLAGERRTLPLAVRWAARGRTTGFALIAYDAPRPDRLTVLPPRTLTVTARPEDQLERAATGR